MLLTALEQKQKNINSYKKHTHTFIRTQNALRPLGQRTRAAQPLPVRYPRYTVARLVHADVAAVAEHHLVALLRIRRPTNVTDDVLIVFYT